MRNWMLILIAVCTACVPEVAKDGFQFATEAERLIADAAGAAADAADAGDGTDVSDGSADQDVASNDSLATDADAQELPDISADVADAGDGTDTSDGTDTTDGTDSGDGNADQDVATQDLSDTDETSPSSDAVADIFQGDASGADLAADAPADETSAADAPLTDAAGETADAVVDSDADSGVSDTTAAETADSAADGTADAQTDALADTPGPACPGVIPCDDGNPCTVDTCDKLKGCVSLPTDASCSDDNPCTVGDSCQNGNCVGGQPVVCKALDNCHLAGTCNVANGMCTSPAKVDGLACSDDNLCTTGESCQQGSCAGGKVVVCTATDSCHEPGTCTPTGGCTKPPKADGAACTDGKACTTNDICKAGACSGAAVVCTAADSCHVPGACNPASGICSVVAEVDGAACNDGDACTKADSCQAGKCKGTAPGCPPLGLCFEVSVCDPKSGVCSQPPKVDGAPCTDNNPCTATDTCKAGTCQGGKPTSCDDANACTDDACFPASGCLFSANKAVCSDGDACTAGDYCQAKSCNSGEGTTSCDDKDSCTADSCVQATGCKHDKIGSCGDGLCTCGETIANCAPDCAPGCGDGVCDGDESAPACPADCGFLTAHLAGACVTPGSKDSCGDGFVCVARSTAGGGNVCVADFDTWGALPDQHPASDFVESTDYVFDKRTQLSWAKEATPNVDWQTSLTVCKAKSYGGFVDWRQPTATELHTLVDFGTSGPAWSAPNLQWPANDPTFYWSASPAPGFSGPPLSWTVFFLSGNSDPQAQTSSFRVRCVR